MSSPNKKPDIQTSYRVENFYLIDNTDSLFNSRNSK